MHTFPQSLIRVAALCFAPVITLAHDSIAAQYVVPDDILVQVPYQPDQHGSFRTVQPSYKSGWYAGAGLGMTEVSPEGSSGGFYVEDDSDWGYKLFAGWRFRPHLSAELSYVDIGEAGLGNVNPAIAASISDATISYRIPTLSASYHLFGPSRYIDVFGRVGLSSIINSVSDDRIAYEKQTTVQLNLGAGVQWRFHPKWFARVEYDSFDNDASLFALSVGRYFSVHSPHRALPDPIPVEKAPPPEPVCAQFEGAIDAIQFEVDSAELKPESYATLETAAASLKLFPLIRIHIDAHTDSIGTTEYNLPLSERRANAIRDYLIELGIDSARLIAKGYGESQPRADNDTEAGRALNRRVEFRLQDNSPCSASKQKP